jgi:DNA-binding GntR family transcriptional regulator
MSKDQKDLIVNAFEDIEPLIAARDHVSVFYRDFRFHTLIYEASGNSMLRSIHTHMLGHFFRLAYLSFFKNGDPDERSMRHLVSSHDKIIEAIDRESIGQSDHATSEHTIQSYRRVVELLAGDRMNEVRELSISPLKV